MITEDYVSFETAKLLKEKGFDWNCESKRFYPEPDYDQESPDGVYAPTLQMAMKWLREQYNIHFFVKYFGSIGWAFTIQKLDSESEHTIGEFYTSYEKAVEAAIRYCVENLI